MNMELFAGIIDEQDYVSDITDDMTTELIETQYMPTERSVSEVDADISAVYRESAVPTNEFSAYIDLTDNTEPLTWFVYGCIPDIEIVPQEMSYDGPPIYQFRDYWGFPNIVITESKEVLYNTLRRFGTRPDFIAGPFSDKGLAMRWLQPITNVYNGTSALYFPEQFYHAMRWAYNLSLDYDFNNRERVYYIAQRQRLKKARLL